jgi:hypothetical protein
MDELPVVEEKTRDENKEARQPRSLLDLLEHFPGKTLCCTKVPLHIVAPVGVVGLRTCWRRRRRTNLSEDYGPPPRGNPPPVRPKSAASRLVKIPFPHFTFSTDPSIFQGCGKSL